MHARRTRGTALAAALVLPLALLAACGGDDAADPDPAPAASTGTSSADPSPTTAPTPEPSTDPSGDPVVDPDHAVDPPATARVVRERLG